MGYAEKVWREVCAKDDARLSGGDCGDTRLYLEASVELARTSRLGGHQEHTQCREMQTGRIARVLVQEEEVFAGAGWIVWMSWLLVEFRLKEAG